MIKKNSELEQLFGGLYYEEGGYFHPVGNYPKFIERAEKLLVKEKRELIKKIEGLRKVIPEEELQDYTRGWYVGANEVLKNLLSEMQEEVRG